MSHQKQRYFNDSAVSHPSAQLSHASIKPPYLIMTRAKVTRAKSVHVPLNLYIFLCFSCFSADACKGMQTYPNIT